MNTYYDVIIIGAGPAGILVSLTLLKMGFNNVLLLEQGKDINKRDRKSGRDLLCGWGGAGAYSDGKLNLSTEVGGFLNELISAKKLETLILEADNTYLDYGAPGNVFGTNKADMETLSSLALKS